MSTKTTQEMPARPGRVLLSLGILLLTLSALLLGGIQFSDAEATPKLALDLEGGTQIILTPKTTDGSQIGDEDIDQAIAIIRQRVDASGVAEAEITRQGQQNIVVGLPGEPDQATLDLVRQSAQLRFRPVIEIGDAGTITPAILEAFRQQEAGEEITPIDPDAPRPTRQEIEEAAFAKADRNGDGVLASEPDVAPAHNSDPAWFTEQIEYDYWTLDCYDPANLAGGDEYDPAGPAVACQADIPAKYVLGPADLEGTDLDSASSGPRLTPTGAVTNEFAVYLDFNNEGADIFRDVTSRLMMLPPPQNQFAAVLDGIVISAPGVDEVIPNGEASITGGGFTPENTAALANQLSFGSLPLNFEVQSEEQISATLGIEQLERGILAGLIGLGLVVVYMLIQYHALGFVALASLTVAALLSYLAIALLSWTTGYRLSLAGVAGLIVAIGITADSFIVYFERIRDEVREGRRLTDAVDHGWVRARRTILASDAVNFLAAVVLYFLAVGGVRGFAFTLGLTTVMDLAVVFLFTHPIMQVLIRTRYFGEGRRFSGLDPEHLGASQSTYRGRGQFAPPRGAKEPEKVPISTRKKAAATTGATAGASQGTAASAATEATDVVEASVSASEGRRGRKPSEPRSPVPAAEGEYAGMTIAERRAAQREKERAAAAADGSGSEGGA